MATRFQTSTSRRRAEPNRIGRGPLLPHLPTALLAARRFRFWRLAMLAVSAAGLALMASLPGGCKATDQATTPTPVPLAADVLPQPPAKSPPGSSLPLPSAPTVPKMAEARSAVDLPKPVDTPQPANVPPQLVDPSAGSSAAANLAPLARLAALPYNSASSTPDNRSSLPTDSGVNSSNAAQLERCLSLLHSGDAMLHQADTAQATFHKRERLGGQLEEKNVMHMKVRRYPLAVYMRWHKPDEGREAIWQENANDNQILIHLGGWKGRLLPTIKVDPFSTRAAEGSRRPINTSGPWNFSRRVIALVEGQRAFVDQGLVVRTSEQASPGGRPCYRFQLEHAQPGPQREFHQLVVYIDRERSLPVGLEMHSWPRSEASGEPLLEESYFYENLELHAPLADDDFNVRNPKYGYGSK